MNKIWIARKSEYKRGILRQSLDSGKLKRVASLSHPETDFPMDNPAEAIVTFYVAISLCFFISAVDVWKILTVPKIGR